MQALLDEQIAARLKAECRDECELHRFQRGVYILAQLLDAMGLPKTAKALHKLRYEAGKISDSPPRTPPEPLVHKLFDLPPLPVEPPPPEPVVPLTKRLDALGDTFQSKATGKRRKKATA